MNMAPIRILVVDDDPDARWLAAEALTEHGFIVSEAGDGAQVELSVENERPHLVVLDLGLPGIGGLEILKRLRSKGDLPIIVLTARSAQSDRVVGLELGADDYIVKPFDPRELVARVNAVLRRGRIGPQSNKLDYDGLVIDLISRDVIRSGELMDLPAKEFDLLVFLAQSPRQVFSREQILAGVWNSTDHWQGAATVNEHIHRLRRKLEFDSKSPRWISTVRGVGYRFCP